MRARHPGSRAPLRSPLSRRPANAMIRRLVLAVVLLQPGLAAGLDPCQSKLPDSLRSEFARRLPDYRQVLTSDYDSPTIESERQYHKGNPCLAAEGGDFDGNGRLEFVFLGKKSGGGLKAFVGLRDAKTWRIQELWDLGSEYVGCCYANVLPPGRYENFYGTTPDPDEPPAPDERLVYTSKTQAPIVGRIESSGIAFFLSRGRWLHVWVSD